MQPDQPQSSPEPTVPNTPSEPAPSPSSGSKKRLFTGIVAGVIVVLLVIGALVWANYLSNKKPANTTTTKNGKTYISNANTDGATIKGVVLDTSLRSGYKEQSAQVSDINALKKQVKDEGLTDQLTITGSVAYGTTQNVGGNAVIIDWGTTGSAYNKNSYNAAYNAYAIKTYQQAGASVKITSLSPLNVKTTSGKIYSLPCALMQVAGDGTTQYSVTCQGTLGSSKAFVSYGTISDTQAEAQSVLTTFVGGSKIEY